MSYIIWKNKHSDTVRGLLISKLPPITKPQIKTNITEIDGVDGDIIEKIGYKSYTKILNIALTRNYDIDNVIEYFSGDGYLTFSNEKDKYYKASIVDDIDYNNLLNFKTASIKFHVQPFKYKLNEEKIILNVTNQKQIKVINQGNIESKPLIEIIGSGSIELSLNNMHFCSLELSENDNIIIDSEKQDAYFGGKLLNNKMLGFFPSLISGENIITWSGNISKIIIFPNSRWL